MTQERRQTNRYNVWFMMKVEPASGGGGETAAVSHNASQNGMLFATAANLDPGAPVKVKLRVTADSEERLIEARIVRVETNPHDTLGLWPHLVAVEIAPSMDDLDAILAEAAERTAPRPEDRREATRHSVWFPMKVETVKDPDGVAVSRNVSETGVLMLSAGKLDPGSTVTVTFRLDKTSPDRTVEAKIIRSEANASDNTGLWPWRIAVEFVEPLPELEPLLREAAKKDA